MQGTKAEFIVCSCVNQYGGDLDVGMGFYRKSAWQ